MVGHPEVNLRSAGTSAATQPQITISRLGVELSKILGASPAGCGRALTDSVVAKPRNARPTASAAFRPIYGGLPATRHTNRAALLRLICRDSWCTSEADE